MCSKCVTVAFMGEVRDHRKSRERAEREHRETTERAQREQIESTERPQREHRETTKRPQRDDRETTILSHFGLIGPSTSDDAMPTGYPKKQL